MPSFYTQIYYFFLSFQKSMKVMRKANAKIPKSKPKQPYAPIEPIATCFVRVSCEAGVDEDVCRR